MLDKIANAVERLGIEVEQVHGESAGGQFEVVTGHEVAMTVSEHPPSSSQQACSSQTSSLSVMHSGPCNGLLDRSIAIETCREDNGCRNLVKTYPYKPC